MATINANSLCIDLANELGEVLQTELVHVLISKVHDSVGVGRVQYFTWKHRMSQKLSQDLWCRKNVLAKLK